MPQRMVSISFQKIFQFFRLSSGSYILTPRSVKTDFPPKPQGTPKQRLRLPLAALLSLLRRLRPALGTIGIGVGALKLGQLFGLQLLHALLVGHRRWVVVGLQEERVAKYGTKCLML